MAQVSLSISIDAAPAWEAVEELARAHKALTHRHGPAFRALERRIALMLWGRGQVVGKAVELIGQPGALILPASPEAAALLVEARGLGVIA